MLTCSKCGTPLPEDAKFCPVCGAPAPISVDSEVTAAAPSEESPAVVPLAEESAAPVAAPAAAGWYQSSGPNDQEVPPAAPSYAAAKPSIGRIFDFYRKAFDILLQKPIRLWGLSLLYVVIGSIISSLGAAIPLISLPIVLLLNLGFTGVLLDGFHGKDVRSEQLFQSFRKDVIVRNGAGVCWKELWTLIWGFVPVMNVIKYYSYCFVPYILLTDAEISPTEALRKSMRMTDGYKGKLFGADILLSLGVVVLIAVLGGLSQIRYIGFIFAIALVLCYLAIILFLPIFTGLVHTAFFEAIKDVHKE